MLSSGLSSLRLSEARAAGACIALALVALTRGPSSLQIHRRELLRLALFGIVGVAFVQLFYFPWWSFPAHATARTVSLQGHLSGLHLPVWALVLWVIVLGSAVPFVFIVGALRHITRRRPASPRCSSPSSPRSRRGSG